MTTPEITGKPYFDPREAPVHEPAPGPTVFYSARAEAQAILERRAAELRRSGTR